MNRKVSIIGAGLVGSLWAVLLRQKNFEVSVYEKRSDPRKNSMDSGRSINLVITSRGIRALTQAGLLDKALELSVPVFGRMIHSKKGELNYQPYGQENEKNLSISRAKLNQFLINAAEKAGAQFHFDQDLQKINFAEKKLNFSNQKEISYDVLFGTDGAGSVVRKMLVQVDPKKYVEKTEWLNAHYKELFLPNPNTLEKKALHIWPRGTHMMMALANLDGSFTVTLYLPQKGPVSFENVKTPNEVQKLFQNEFPDAIPLMPQFVDDYSSHPPGSLGTIRCSHWVYQDSVCLMGDAAHAIVPFFGQGMNSGFEDCTQFLNIWESLKVKPVFNSEIFKIYDEMQRPNANAIADMAIENWIEMSEKVADPQFLLRKKVEAVLEKKFPEIFKSRYGMVTYTLIPYHLVQKAGFLQEQIFQELCRDLEDVADLSLADAESLLRKVYVPFLKLNQLELK